MENKEKERRHLSHHALVESAIRMTKQLASSNDIMTRSLANRMFSDLTLLRRGLPTRRQHEAIHGNPATTGALDSPVRQNSDITAQKPAPLASQPTAQSQQPGSVTPPARNDVPPQTPSELHILQTRERIKTHPLVLCVHTKPIPQSGAGDAGATMDWELHTISPEGKPLGLLDFAVSTDGANLMPDRQRAFGLTAKCTSRPAHAVYCSDLMAAPGEFIRACQAQASTAEWMLHVPDSHTLARNDLFWAGVCAGEMLGDAEFTAASHGTAAKVPLRLWARRMEIPGEGEERHWATCLVAQAIGPASDEKPMRLLTNRAIPDLGHAAEIVSWQRTVLAFEQFAATDRVTFHSTVGAAAHHVENWRMAQLAWHLEQELEVEASQIFSANEILAAHALAGRSLPADSVALADMLTLLIDLGSRHAAETELNAGLRRLADAVAGLELASR